MNIEQVILNNLIYNEQYTRKTVAFLKSEYFSDHSEKTVFDLIDSYLKKYNRLPTKETLLIDLSNKTGLSEVTFKEAKNVVENINNSESSELQWLLDKTEKWCQEKALHNAIYESIQILDDKSGKKQKGVIPELLSDALAVSFDTHIGHDFLEDAEVRYEFYHTKEIRIPFDLDYFNKITTGGLPKKTLNVALAGCVHPETKIKIRYRKK